MRTLRGLVLLVVAGSLLAGGVWAFRTSAGASPDGPSRTVAVPGERVRVEVLNAAGVSGLARTATEALRDSGFDVVHFGNARTFDRDTTVVIDRAGRPDLAGAVANALGIGNVRSEPDPNLFVEVSVLLGRDWSSGGGESGVSATPRPSWDPRGWIGR